MDPRIAARRAHIGRATQRTSLRRLALVLAFASLLAAIVWYLFSPYVDVDQITVGGIAQADVDAVLDELGVEEGNPLLLVPTGRIEDRLAEDPWVSSVNVTRIIPGTVEIAVIERLPALTIESPGGAALVALDGTVLTEVETRPEDVPVFLGAGARPAVGSVVQDGPVAAILGFLDEFGPMTGLARFEMQEQELWLRLPDHDVRLGRPVDMAAKAASLRAVLGEQPDPGLVIVLIAPERPTLQSPQQPETTSEPDGESQPQQEG